MITFMDNFISNWDFDLKGPTDIVVQIYFKSLFSTQVLTVLIRNILINVVKMTEITNKLVN